MREFTQAEIEHFVHPEDKVSMFDRMLFDHILCTARCLTTSFVPHVT